MCLVSTVTYFTVHHVGRPFKVNILFRAVDRMIQEFHSRILPPEVVMSRITVLILGLMVTPSPAVLILAPAVMYAGILLLQVPARQI